MWSGGRRKATAAAQNRSQARKALGQRRVDRRSLEMERRKVCLGIGTLGQVPARQEMGGRSLEEDSAGTCVGQGALEIDEYNHKDHRVLKHLFLPCSLFLRSYVLGCLTCQ